MVSKTIKIRASKFSSIKNRHGIRRHHRRSSTISNVVLARIAAQNGSFKILPQIQSPDPASWSEHRPQTTCPPLPPSTSPEKRTVFLDLDETLVHSSSMVPKRFDFVVRPVIRGTEMTFYVTKRPGVDQFLQKLAEKYEVVVFTAGLREYATLVVDRLDKQNVISHRLYRDSCKQLKGRFVKDMSGLGRDLRRVVIVDDNPNSYSLQPENGVPVRPFVHDMADRELGRLLEFFEGEGSRCFEDIRDVVREYVNDGAGRISYVEDIDNDNGGSDSDDDDDDDDDDELEKENGESINIPVLKNISSTPITPCCLINMHEYYPADKPVAMEGWVKTVIIGSFILTLTNVILCSRLFL